MRLQFLARTFVVMVLTLYQGAAGGTALADNGWYALCMSIEGADPEVCRAGSEYTPPPSTPCEGEVHVDLCCPGKWMFTESGDVCVCPDGSLSNYEGGYVVCDGG